MSPPVSHDREGAGKGSSTTEETHVSQKPTVRRLNIQRCDEDTKCIAPGLFSILSPVPRVPLGRVVHAVKLVQLQRHHHI